MPEQVLQLALAAPNGSIRYETLDGRRHLVAPIIPIVEGVLNRGKITGQEISHVLSAWNGIPVTANHPNERGVNVSANTPRQLEASTFGRFFGARFEDNRLKGDIWIDEAKALALGGEAAQALERIKHNGRLEVSTGIFCDIEHSPGQFNGKAYDEIWSNLRPDHLAMLPNDEGACSWADGAGTPRLNQKSETDSITAQVLAAMKSFFHGRGQDMKDKVQIIKDLIASKGSQFGESDAELLATFSDEQLAKLTEGAAGVLKTNASETDAEKKAREDAVAAGLKVGAKAATDETPKTFEKELEAMPDSPLKASMQALVADNEAETAGIVAELDKLEACQLKADALKTMALPVLRALRASFIGEQSPADYSGRGLPAARSNDDGAIPPPPALVINKSEADAAKTKAAASTGGK